MFVVARSDVLLFVYVLANETWKLTSDTWHIFHRNHLTSKMYHLFQIVENLQEDSQVY